jgi:hypothetical protein
MPMAVKVFHRHNHVFTISKNAKNETTVDVYHKICPICAFHFFHFNSTHKFYHEYLKECFGELVFAINEVVVNKYFFLSFLLRSPPVLLILITI